MTAASSQTAAYADGQISYRLIRRCSLSDDDVARINSAERSLGIGFSDAAVRLGLVSQDDVRAVQLQDFGINRLPRKATVPSDRLELVRDPYGQHSEYIRALRTELLLRRNQPGQADLMAVLSPGANEGRSYLAAELAIAFAQLGKPTLLVDADLRNPSQHLLFDAQNETGLSDALAQGSTPAAHPVQGLPYLSVLTSGSTQRNPLELLSGGWFEQVVEEWQRSYAFVVLDTAPVNHYSDGLAVANLTGRVLLLSRAQHTRHRDTKDLLRKLAATQSQILGAVITHF